MKKELILKAFPKLLKEYTNLLERLKSASEACLEGGSQVAEELCHEYANFKSPALEILKAKEGFPRYFAYNGENFKGIGHLRFDSKYEVVTLRAGEDLNPREEKFCSEKDDVDYVVCSKSWREVTEEEMSKILNI